MGSDNSHLAGHRRDLLRYVGRRVEDAALREDIVQEAFLRLLTYQAKPGTTVSNVAGLLRRISLNLTRDHFRQSGRFAAVELSDDLPCQQPGAHQQLEQQQLIGIVAGILKAMPRLRREVFIHRRVHGHSAREVADLMGLSPGAVDTHVARAILDLHMAIEKIEKRGGPVRG